VIALLTIVGIILLVLAVFCVLKAISDYDESWLGLAILAVLFGCASLTPFYNQYRCGAQWSDFENRYGIIEGCMVKQGDKWFPEERVRAIEE
jgi:hypothetical protein